jgi:hypothetical protein
VGVDSIFWWFLSWCYGYLVSRVSIESNNTFDSTASQFESALVLHFFEEVELRESKLYLILFTYKEGLWATEDWR